MICTQCGKQNDTDAVYCQKCGRMIEAEIETRVAPRPGSQIDNIDSPEREIFSISPTLKFVKVGYVAAVLAAFVFVALLSLTAWVPTWLAVILGLLLLLIPGFYHLRRSLVRYRLTDAKIEIDSGLVAQTTRNVPLGRIQDVTVSRTIPQRLLGFGDIVIDNASEDGGKIVLKDIDSPREYADRILGQMRRSGR